MESRPLHILGKCVSQDEQLFAHMAHALTLGLPEISGWGPSQPGPLAIVGSGPSVSSEIDTLRELHAAGVPIVAVRDAHDWLLAQGIVPAYAFSVDPLEKAVACFAHPHPGIHYMIASQSHPKMWETLAGMKVTLCHLYVKKGQEFPPNKILIAGSTTSGLRAISVFYVLGYRDFHLFGLDSCLSGKTLRINGDESEAAPFPITLEPGGEEYWTVPSMAQQAYTFQDCYALMPDATFTGYGRGLIQAMIEKKKAQTAELLSIERRAANNRVSFIHAGGPSMASYRYRAAIPARELGESVNDLSAGTLIFAKPRAEELLDMARAKRRGQRVIVDFCDDHFDWMHYKEALQMADMVTCNTPAMAERIRERGREATVIPDPYEYPEEPPHCMGQRLLWFGHESNKMTLARIMPDLEGYPLRVVSNFAGAIPWSAESMPQHFTWADIVIMPATETYKSANRAVEAIRQGCFVVAEPHPAWNDIPGIWLGKIKDGIEWTGTHSTEANARISMAQSYVTEKYSPKTAAAAWKAIIQSPITSDVEAASGPDGSTSTLAVAQT